MHRARLLLILAASAALALPVAAQPNAVHRTTLQQQDFPAPLHTVTVRVEIDPGGEVAPHTHPGVEMGFIVSGRMRLAIAGSKPKLLGAGDSFAVPPRTVHSGKNVGAAPLVILSTYVVDPREPLASPAP
jgi:quercetin dioxygenase-like cupin family protein